MHFKNTTIKYLLLLTLSLFMISCDSSHSAYNENIIGSRLSTTSFTSDSENTERLNLFDDTTRRIHSFELNKEITMSSFAVLNPEDTHYILASNDTGFVADLSRSQLSIYRYDGSMDRDVINFMGEPISSDYDKASGYLVVYDNLQSVSLLKINTAGHIESLWVGGPIISDGGTILAGEVNNEDLILSLSDNSLAIVDMKESIRQEKWVYRLDTPSLNENIKWVASISEDVILYQTDKNLVLYDYTNALVIDQKSFPDDYYTQAYSKSGNPHVVYNGKRFKGIFADTSDVTFDGTLISYVEGNEIKSKELMSHRDSEGFYQSRLDLSKNLWSYIEAGGASREEDFVMSHSMETTNRRLLSFRFSDMLALTNMDLPDHAKVKRTQEDVFALYPSELGYAERINIESEDQSEIRNFNVPYIQEVMDGRR